jgi:hypothetical protein
VSSFDGQSTAEQVIRNAVHHNLADVTAWGSRYTAEEHEIYFRGSLSVPIGFGLTLASPTTFDKRHHALIVLRQIAPPDCRIFILTAYPIQNAEERIQE